MLARLALENGESARAIEFQEKAMGLIRRSGADPVAILHSMKNLAMAYEDAGYTDTAVGKWRDALYFSKQHFRQSPNSAAAILWNMGRCLEKNKQTHEAIIAYEQSIKMAFKGNRIEFFFGEDVGQDLSRLYRQTGQDEKADKLEEMLTIWKTAP